MKLCRYAMSGPYKEIYACFSCREVPEFLEQQAAGRRNEGEKLLHLWME